MASRTERLSKFDPGVAATRETIDRAKDFGRSAKHDLEQYQRWLAQYAEEQERDRQKHERRLRRFEAEHRRHVKYRYIRRRARRRALAFVATLRSVSLTIWSALVFAARRTAQFISSIAIWAGGGIRAAAIFAGTWTARFAALFASYATKLARFLSRQLTDASLFIGRQSLEAARFLSRQFTDASLFIGRQSLRAARFLTEQLTRAAIVTGATIAGAWAWLLPRARQAAGSAAHLARQCLALLWSLLFAASLRVLDAGLAVSSWLAVRGHDFARALPSWREAAHARAQRAVTAGRSLGTQLWQIIPAVTISARPASTRCTAFILIDPPRGTALTVAGPPRCTSVILYSPPVRRARLPVRIARA